MPGLFALAAHPALAAVQAQLNPDEAVFAFLDDIYMASLAPLVGVCARLTGAQG